MLNLLRYGLGLGYFKNYKVCETSNCFKTMIDDLKTRSLLDVDEQGNVKMHDIVRETAIRIAHTNEYAFREKDGNILTDWPSKGDISGCKIVSVPHSRDIRQLSEDLGCPDVEFLLLFSDWQSIKIPNSAFEGTTKLRVIHFARMQLASFPVGPLHSLTNLHTLCLEDCHLLDLTTIRHLESLVILSFRGSELEALPSEIGELTPIKVLDLTGCSKLSFIRAGVLSKLTALEELLMRNSFENWEVEEGTSESNARLSELKCLPRLESLEICVPDTRALPKDLFSKRLERFHILIGRGREFDHDSKTTNTLKLKPNTNADLLQTVRELMRESETLYLDETGGSKNHLYDLEKEGFLKLKKLVVMNSCELQQVVDCRKWGPIVCFPLLESLELKRLQSLMTICQGRPAPESFSKIKRMKIHGCAKLKILFSLSAVQSLPQLEGIDVSGCKEMEALFVAESISVAEFPRLCCLRLDQLPQLKCFLHARDKPIGSGGSETATAELMPFFNEKVAPNLKEMSIDDRIFKSMSCSWNCLIGLESLQLSIFGRTLMEVSQLQSTPHLRKLVFRDWRGKKLWGCQTSVIDAGEPSSIRILELYDIERLRHVWRPDSQMDPVLPYLEILELCYCYDLVSLASSPSASFRSLSTLELFCCYKVTELVNPSIARTMANLVKLSIQHCGALKEIVAAEEQQDGRTNRECIVFNKLKTLILYDLDRLEGFCISGSYSFEFPCLEKVSVEECPAMRIFCNGEVITPKLHNVESIRLWGRDLNTTIKLHHENELRPVRDLRLSRYPELIERWGREPPVKGFGCINVLVVDQLALLPVAVPSNVLPALSGLNKLVVEKCDSVEEIFDMDGMDQQNEDHVTFMLKLKRLDLVELPKLRHVWNENLPRILGLKNLSVLKVHNCGNLTHIFTLGVALGLVHLESLYVTVCPLVEVIIKQLSDEQLPADWDRCNIFPMLDSVQLEHLPILMEFFSGDDVLRCPNMKSVRIEGCPRMCLLGSTDSSTEQDKNIIVRRHEDSPCDGDVREPILHILNKQVEISRLEKLTVEWNSSMDNAWHEIVPQSFVGSLEVVKLMGFPADHELLPSDYAQRMPNLEQLTIVDSFCKQILPKGPRSISEIHPAVSFKKLTHLQLFNLPELNHLVEEDSQLGSLFQHLKILKVSKCKRLTRLVTSITATGLVNLVELVVEECERMTEVLSSNTDDVSNEIVFEQLKSLKLCGLPCLSSFSSGNCTFNFPSLKRVLVLECLNMKSFAKNAQTTPMLNFDEISREGDDDDDDYP